jgi:hypothetical protein
MIATVLEKVGDAVGVSLSFLSICLKYFYYLAKYFLI